MGRAQRGEDRAGVGGAGHPHERPGRARGGREPDARQGRGAGRALWQGHAARQLRGAARRSGGGRDLHPAAEPPACRMDGEVPRGRQARALREAARAQGRGDRPADRAPRPDRARGGGGLHGHPPSAVGPGAGAGPPGRHRQAPPGAGRLHLLQRGSREHPQPRRHGRGRAARHRGLSLDLHPLRQRRGAHGRALCRDRVGPRASTPPRGWWRSSRASAWSSTSPCAWRRGRS